MMIQSYRRGELDSGGFPCRGSILFIAVFVIGFMAVLAWIFHFTAKQSRSAARRIFWGEASYFICESLNQEAFSRLSSSVSLMTKILAANGSLVPLDVSFRSPKALKMSEEMGFSVAKATVQARAIVLYQGGEKLQDSEDKAGVIELVSTVELSGGFGFAKDLLSLKRQILSRRDFRQIRMTGDPLLTGYALLLKSPPSVQSAGDPFDRLKLNLPGGTGRVFLGNYQENLYVDPVSFHEKEKQYLISQGFSEGVNNSGGELLLDKQKWDSISIEEKKNQYLLRLLSDFPIFKQEFASLSDPLYMALNNYFLASSGPITAEVNFHPSKNINLSFDPGENGNVQIEGPVYRRFSQEVKRVEIPGEAILGHSLIEGGYTSVVDVWIAGIFGIHSLIPPFNGIADFEEPASFRGFLPYRKSLAYARIYPEMNEKRTPWQIFLDENARTRNTDGRILRLDGIAGILGKAEITEPILYEGVGVIVVMDGISIQSGIKPLNPEKDRLILVSRCDRPDGIFVSTSEEIHALIRAHNFNFSSKKGKFAASDSFRIKGGISADFMEINQLPSECKLTYDPAFQLSIFENSVSGIEHYFKIFNSEKIKPEDGETKG